MDLFYIFIGLLPITKKNLLVQHAITFFFPSLTFTGVTFLNMARYTLVYTFRYIKYARKNIENINQNSWYNIYYERVHVQYMEWYY